VQVPLATMTVMVVFEPEVVGLRMCIGVPTWLENMAETPNASSHDKTCA
jgi:hypothetical protein